MADYPELTVTDLSTYSGRPVISYSAYAPTAIAQALLLWKIRTRLKDWPDDKDSQDLAQMGILAMADHLVLVQPYQKAEAIPFNSEGVGSYHYSRVASRTAQTATKGDATGVMWFDLAAEKLGVAWDVENVPMGGGITVWETPTSYSGAAANNWHFLSPAEKDLTNIWGWDMVPDNSDRG